MTTADQSDYAALNILTAENLVKAREEIVYGDRVQVDWPLNHPAVPTSGRKCFEHKILHFDADPLKPGLVGNDDEVSPSLPAAPRCSFASYAFRSTSTLKAPLSGTVSSTSRSKMYVYHSTSFHKVLTTFGVEGSRMYYNGLTQDEIMAGTDGGRLGISHCAFLGL